MFTSDTQTFNTRRVKSKVVATLSLTSLIDAFSILVIYLLLVTQNGLIDLDLKTQVLMPEVESAPFIESEPLVVRLENNRFFIKDQVYNSNQLTRHIRSQIQSKQSLLVGIQADRTQDFEGVEKLIQVIRQSGVEKIELLAERNL